mgnify:CR=1 FL=1|tara:strand:+ start:22271 stop:23557 length:1287 start_codon:yes stop_codon:yes gene_type:complete
MSYYRFTRNDKFVNTLKLFPELKFTIYNGSAYYNDTPNFSGSFTGSIVTPEQGSLSLYELNVDRAGTVGLQLPGAGTIGTSAVKNTGLIYPWIVKDGSRLNFRTSTSAAFTASAPGAKLYGNYPLSASISKEYYTTTTARSASAQIDPLGPVIDNVGYVTHILALKNTINYYQYLSPQFQYSSDADMITAGVHNRDFNTNELGLVSIPSMFYGSQIKKGTVKLDIYYTGSLVATAEDRLRNGELIETYNPHSGFTGSVIGLVLYNEGFLILTGAADLNNSTDEYVAGAAVDQPKWVYFAQSISGSVTAPNTTFIMTMSGTTNTQVMTMFATAPKGQLNHSNNPSYLKSFQKRDVSTGSYGYIEGEEIRIKNIVSSSYNTPTGSFEKLTYVSKVGLYDKDYNLIAVAKPATPIKKSINKDFTFKLKLDI